MNAIISFSVRHRGFVVLAVVLLTCAALFSATRLRLDAFPDLTNVQVQILTNSPGMSAEEVELLVTTPVERALSGIPGLETTRSLSRTGVSAVTAVFTDDTELWRARQLVGERIATIGDAIPDAAGTPELGPPTTGLGEVFQFVVQSDVHSPGELTRIYERILVPRLRTVPGVVEVNAWSAAAPELHVLVNPWRLAATGTTLDEVNNALSQAIGRASGGAQTQGAEQTLVFAAANPDSVAALEAVPIRGSGAHTLRVGDVANVVESTALDVGVGSANGRGAAIFAMAQLIAGGDARTVVRDTRDALNDALQALPEGVHVEVIYDRERLVANTLKTVAKSLSESGLLVIFILFVLLGDLRAGAVVASVIPLSMLGALSGLRLVGMSGNLMSLGAIDFGMIVDGTIVLVEAVMAFELAKRSDLPRIVVESSNRVAKPVLFAFAILMIVYIPILAMWGVEGKLFRPMATTVLFALATAMALTFTWVPAISSWVLRPRGEHRTWIVRKLEAAYHPLLAGALGRPQRALWGAISLFALSVWVASVLPVEFIPRLQEGDIVIQTTHPASISPEQALRESTNIERAALEFPEVLSVASRTGSAALATDPMGMEQADILLHLRPKNEWTTATTTEGLMSAIAARVQEASPGAALNMTQPIEMRFNELLEGITGDVGIRIFGPDLTTLERLGEDVAEILRSIDGAADVVAPPSGGVPSVQVNIEPDLSGRYGVSAETILTMTTAVQRGHEVGKVVDGAFRNSVIVRLDLPRGFELAELPIVLENGIALPLDQLASISRGEVPNVVLHEEGERRVVVVSNVRGRDLGAFVEEARARIDAELTLPDGYWIAWSGRLEQLQTAASRLLLLVPLTLIFILVLLRVAFGRFKPGLLIFLNVPIAVSGGIFALWLRGLPLSVSAIVGFIALAGVAIMNGIVMVSRILELHGERSALKAAGDAARERFRPVLMTAAVAAFGFLPMALNTGVGAEVQRPLATVVIGGIFTATTLTLLIVPSLYVRWFSNEDRTEL